MTVSAGASRLLVGVVVAVTVTLLLPTSRAGAQVVPSQWVLTSFCTPAQDFPEFRRFRVRNSTDAAEQVVLRNQNTGQETSVTAPPGDSFHLVPAAPSPTAANTTQLIVGGVAVATKAANNRACTTLTGSAVCNTGTGLFDVTWTATSEESSPRTITDVSIPGLVFSPNPIPAQGRSVATEQVPPPATGTTVRTLRITVDLGANVVSQPEASVTLGACERPPGTVAFTFTKTPSISVAAPGDVVTYTYAGTNTGNVTLEVVKLVDDRLGVVIEEPVVTLVPPGGLISRPVAYTVTPADASIGTIVNNAVVSVRPAEGADQAVRVASAAATVEVTQPVPPTVNLVGNAVCQNAAAAFAVTWTLANDGPVDAVIAGSSRPGVLDTGTVAPGGLLTGTESVPAPSSGTLDLTLTVRLVEADPVSATITLGPCAPNPPTVSFTFTKTPDRTTATVGETVTYTYAGTNTGGVTLEVVQLVDDRLGLVLQEPAVTLVPPGGSISRQVAYTVGLVDAGSVIANAAVVTVRPAQGPDRAPRSAVARAEVTVPLLPLPPDPPGTLPPTGSTATSLLGIGGLVLVLAGGTLLALAVPGRRRA